MDARDVVDRMVDGSGLTPAELADRLGKSHNYVHVMRRQRSMPRADTLARLCRALGYRLVVESETGNRRFTIG